MVYIKWNLGPENVRSQNSLKEMSFLQNEMDSKRLLWTWIFRKWQKILKKFGTTQTYRSICVLRSEKIFLKKIFEICFFMSSYDTTIPRPKHIQESLGWVSYNGNGSRLKIFSTNPEICPKNKNVPWRGPWWNFIETFRALSMSEDMVLIHTNGIWILQIMISWYWINFV